jgi:nicotinate-nucleotide adenylyltransferase
MRTRNKENLQSNTLVKRIGLFGGTFDPPHIGHLIIAETAWEQLGLEKIYFVPAYIPPHKRGKKCTPVSHRLAMIQLALKGNRHFDMLDCEIKRRGVSYTIDTLRDIKEQYCDDDLFFILGSDNLQQFNTWKKPDEIVKLAHLVVYERPNIPIPRKYSSAIRLNGPLLDISSTDIRAKAMEQRSIRYLVPKAVEQYILKHRLYGK